MLEVCRHCNGECYKYQKFCEFCGGTGINTWIGNMMSKPDRSIDEVVREVLKYFLGELKNDETASKIDKMLEKAFQDTKVTVVLENFDGEAIKVYFIIPITFVIN